LLDYSQRFRNGEERGGKIGEERQRKEAVERKEEKEQGDHDFRGSL
jgi:hypothetical protein